MTFFDYCFKIFSKNQRNVRFKVNFLNVLMNDLCTEQVILLEKLWQYFGTSLFNTFYISCILFNFITWRCYFTKNLGNLKCPGNLPEIIQLNSNNISFYNWCLHDLIQNIISFKMDRNKYALNIYFTKKYL